MTFVRKVMMNFNNFLIWVSEIVVGACRFERFVYSKMFLKNFSPFPVELNDH